MASVAGVGVAGAAVERSPPAGRWARRRIVHQASWAFTLSTMLLNAAVIVVYVISRTAGLPIGAHAGEAESVEGIDLMTAIFEANLQMRAALDT